MKVVILGAGSTAQSVASILLDDPNFTIVGFTDKDNRTKDKKIFGIEVIGKHDVLKDLFKEGVHGAVVAIGYDNNIREKEYHRAKEIGFEMISVIHKSAVIDKHATLNEGVIIGPNCIVSPLANIGQNTILEAGVIVGPQTQIADNVYMGFGCCIGGGGFIKRNAFLGAGCSVASYVSIGKNAKIAPGTTVVKNIADSVRAK